MDNLFSPAILVPAIVFLAVYKVFELIIRRKERMLFIEKWNPSVNLGKEVKLPAFGFETALCKFTSLRVGCILLGVGLGLIVGIMLGRIVLGDTGDPTAYFSRKQMDMTIMASVLFFGGIGMLVSFLVETHMIRKQKEEDQEKNR